MGIKQKAVDMVSLMIKAGIGLLGRRRATLVSARLAQQLIPRVSVKTPRGPIEFYCPGAISLWRAETLLTKEPDTIEWINGFAENHVFWDIGANVGIYSLYAALKSKVTVLAFEPSVFNCYLLNRNIEINKLDDRVFSLSIAFSDKTVFSHFYMGTTEAGGALHSFAQALDWQGKPSSYKFKQGMVGLTIDDFIDKFNPPFPNYIKIDVDGMEDRIIQAAKKTISDKRLKSLIVELDTERPKHCQGTIVVLESCGLKLISKRCASGPGSQEFASVYNHIFVRS